MTNYVSDWMSNVRGAEYGFLKAVVYALEQFDEKNNLPLYAMIAICNGKPFGSYKIIEGDRLVYATPLRRILDKALSGVEFVFKDRKVSVRVSPNGGVNHDALETLRMLGTIPGMSIRNDAFKAAFPAKEKVKKTIEAEKGAKHVAKYLKGNGLSLGDVLDLIRAEMAVQVVTE